jgi:hypothetical protein
MANDAESESSEETQGPPPRSAAWLKLAVLTAGSALAGGVAAAWWYRKTLARLRETEELNKNPHFGMPDDQPADESDDI